MSAASFKVTDPHALYTAVDPLTDKVAVELARLVVANTPRKTGKLASSWVVVKRRTGEHEVTNSVPYGRFVEYGTKYVEPKAMMGKAAAQIRGKYCR